MPIVEFDRTLRAMGQQSLRERLELAKPTDLTLVQSYEKIRQVSETATSNATAFWRRGLDVIA